MIKFLLNQEIREETQLSPNMTVLDYLRTKINKTGTKEGCSSGDCGACTVVLGEPVDGQLRYRAINSCLTFVSALHGKQLITIEDLKQENDTFHPVQKALVQYHGSQCGYCTPGFIMSMFALSKNRPQADKEDILESLAGNLCRCTGYRPIIDAAMSLSNDQPLLDQFSKLEQQTIEKLQSISLEGVTLSNGELSSFSPTTTDELAELLLTHPDARIVAGGTDLAIEVTQLHREFPKLISIGLVADMKVISQTDTNIIIGANVPINDCYDTINSYYPDFGKLLDRFASLQVRNQGTFGGNIGNASPIGDIPPLLIALNASIVLRHGKTSRTLPIEEYFIDYKVTAQKESEFIEKIILPKPIANNSFSAYKLSKRIDDDISAVCGAFNIELQDNTITAARIAFGGMAAIPKRAVICEQNLIGQPWNAATIKTAMAALATEFKPLSDFRASKEYRSQTAANMLYRCFIEQQNSNKHIETRVTSYV